MGKLWDITKDELKGEARKFLDEFGLVGRIVSRRFVPHRRHGAQPGSPAELVVVEVEATTKAVDKNADKIVAEAKRIVVALRKLEMSGGDAEHRYAPQGLQSRAGAEEKGGGLLDDLPSYALRGGGGVLSMIGRLGYMAGAATAISSIATTTTPEEDAKTEAGKLSEVEKKYPRELIMEARRKYRPWYKWTTENADDLHDEDYVKQLLAARETGATGSLPKRPAVEGAPKTDVRKYAARKIRFKAREFRWKGFGFGGTGGAQQSTPKGDREELDAKQRIDQGFEPFSANKAVQDRFAPVYDSPEMRSPRSRIDQGFEPYTTSRPAPPAAGPQTMPSTPFVPGKGDKYRTPGVDDFSSRFEGESRTQVPEAVRKKYGNLEGGSERLYHADGNMAGVDPRLVNVMKTASRDLPPGYRAQIISGHDSRNSGTTNHPSGLAVDIEIYDDKGKLVPNHGGPGMGPYERMYQSVYERGRVMYPNEKFIWGGTWISPAAGYGDRMHYQIVDPRVPGSSQSSGAYDPNRGAPRHQFAPYLMPDDERQKYKEDVRERITREQAPAPPRITVHPNPQPAEVRPPTPVPQPPAEAADITPKPFTPVQPPVAASPPPPPPPTPPAPEPPPLPPRQEGSTPRPAKSSFRMQQGSGVDEDGADEPSGKFSRYFGTSHSNDTGIA